MHIPTMEYYSPIKKRMKFYHLQQNGLNWKTCWSKSAGHRKINTTCLPLYVGAKVKKKKKKDGGGRKVKGNGKD